MNYKLKLSIIFILFVFTLVNYQEKFNGVKHFGFYVENNDINKLMGLNKYDLGVYIKKDEYKNGQIIFYKNDNSISTKNVATVTKVNDTKLSVKALDKETEISGNLVYGKLLFKIKGLGAVIMALRNLWILIFIILLPIIGILTNEMDIFTTEIKKEIEKIAPLIRYKLYRLNNKFASKYSKISHIK